MAALSPLFRFSASQRRSDIGKLTKTIDEISTQRKSMIVGCDDEVRSVISDTGISGRLLGKSQGIFNIAIRDTGT